MAPFEVVLLYHAEYGFLSFSFENNEYNYLIHIWEMTLSIKCLNLIKGALKLILFI